MSILAPDALLLSRAPLKTVNGCETLRMHQADDVFGLWEELDKVGPTEAEVPFWATVWPGGVLCAQYLLLNPSLVRDRRVLDLGCGGGIAGIAAAQAGAQKIISNDIDPSALAFAARNAAANNVTLTFDSRDLINSGVIVEVDIILVADMFYQRSQARQTLDYITAAVARGVEVLIADGSRTFAPRDRGTILTTARISVSRDVEGVDEREVRLILLKR
jgi:predicted nicotinamide N-methyase